MKPNLLEETCFHVSEEAAERCSSKLAGRRNRNHRVRCIALTISLFVYTLRIATKNTLPSVYLGGCFRETELIGRNVIIVSVALP